MAALTQASEGLPPSAPTRSYAETLSSPTATKNNLVRRPLLQTHQLAVTMSFEDAISGTHKGFPSLRFEDKHVAALSTIFPWTLVGKFSKGFNKSDPKNGRPPVVDLEKYFQTLDFQSDFSIGLLDNRHLLIQLSSEQDYLRLYSRQVWRVARVTMRVFKWTPYFTVERETSLVPVWVSFPRLPVIFFHESALFRIASLLGSPLRLDAATKSLKRPGVARIQIEIDLLKERPEQIWIGMGSVSGFWQNIEYEHVPDYCTHCWHVGHAESVCTVHNPKLQTHSKSSVLPMRDSQPSVKSQCQASKWIPKMQGIPSADHKSQSTEKDVAAQNVQQVDTNSNLVDARLAAEIAEVATETEGTSVTTSHVDSVCQTIGKNLDVNVPPGPISDVAAEALRERIEGNISTTLEAEGVPNVAIVPMVSTHNEDTATGATAATMSVISATSATAHEIEAVDRATKHPSSGLHTVATQAIFGTLRSDLSIPPAAVVEKVCADSFGQLANVEKESNPRQEQYEHTLTSTPLKGQNAGSPGAFFPKPVVFCGDETLSDATPSSERSMHNFMLVTGLNVNAATWHPQVHGKSVQDQSFQPSHQLPRSYGLALDSIPDDDSNSWRTIDSADENVDEDIGGDDSMEEFLDSHFTRDDLHLQKQKNRQAQRERDMILLRRGRGRPLGSRNRTSFDIHHMSTRSKTLD